MPKIVSCENLTLGYDRHPAVHHLSFDFQFGSLTAIVGPNGGGKSTLLKGIAGSLQPLEGNLQFSNLQPVKIAYLPQQSDVDPSFPVTVIDFISMGLWNDIGSFSGVSSSMEDRIYESISSLGLFGYEDRPIGTLSGGEMQRVLFARLLLQDAELVLLDEPFNSIDRKTTDFLLHLILEWHGEGRTIIIALHDLEDIRLNFPETLILGREKIAHGLTEEVLTEENLSRAHKLCEVFNENADICSRIPTSIL
ncbi:MAG: ABC transporter ATP-binding protein [Nitrospinota bacterium]|nr:ABC transporter ATP-binding protein [Nitrospinota bacterium]